jgi:2-isopropylmalate synthase
MADKLIIFDTTLRDGEQSPGASMTREENDRDISRAAEALKGAKSMRIHTFMATSALHMEKKLRMTPEQVYEQVKLAVRFARKFTDNVEFSPEDASRSDPDFLCRVLEAAIAEGATTINIPDTVGYAVPELFGNQLRSLRERIPNSGKAIWSVHCHNDLGMAVANSLAAVKIGGARQVECTVNGLGERAGNTSLEEIVMALKTRRDYFDLEVGVDTTQIVPASKLVSSITGFPVQPNRPTSSTRTSTRWCPTRRCTTRPTSTTSSSRWRRPRKPASVRTRG